MEFELFKNRFESLNEIHKKIAYSVLRRLEHKYEHKGLKKFQTTIRNKITERRKEYGIGYEELYDLARKGHEDERGFSYEAYQKMISHNRIKSKLFNPVLDVLGLKPHEAMEFSKEFNENLRIMATDNQNLKWLYSTLSDNDRKLIDYLVVALYMEETSPEVFEENEDYDYLEEDDTNN